MHNPDQRSPGALPETGSVSTTPGSSRPSGRPAAVLARRSIRLRLLALASGMMVMAVIILLTAALSAASSVIETAGDISSQVLRRQAEDYLQQINRSIAEQNALLLDRAVGDVQTAADAATIVYSGQAAMVEAQDTLIRGPQGQYFNGADQISSVFIPNTVMSQTLKNSSLSLAVNQDVQYTANLDVSFKSIKENNPNAGSLYIGTVNSVTRYFPNIQLGEILPADFDPTRRPWYIDAIERNQNLAQPVAIWTPVYFDATGLGLVTTVAMPVFASDNAGANRLIGVVGLDITLSEIQTNLRGQAGDQRYSFLVDEQGRAIVLPEQGWQDLLGRSISPDDPTPNLITQAINPEVKSIVENMQRGDQGFQTIQINGAEYFVAYTPFRASMQDRTRTGWSLGTITPATEVLNQVAALETDLNNTTQQVIFTRILPLAGLIAVVLLVVAWAGTNRLIEPILKLADASQKLGAGAWEEPMPQLRQIENQHGGARGDEIGLLAHTLLTMAEQLRLTFGRLEQRVTERTQELERRTLQIETAAEVAQEITQASDLDEMLHNAVNLISQRFGYYNVGIFLVDETSEYAHLKAASGELGKKLLQQDIRLRVGQQGIVGYVTRYGQARLANDVRTDRAYLAAPLLTDTRSELALPLRSGPKIIGALDIQSTRPLAFSSSDDVKALQTLADQLAIAIENLRLVQRLQDTLQEANLLYQQQARQAWERLSAQSGLEAFEYNLLEVRRLEEPPVVGRMDARAEQGVVAIQHGSLLQVPIRLRDQVIGYIGLESAVEAGQDGRVWSDDEIAIVQATANQAALSVENARLLAESQRRAAREQLAAEVTARMRTSLEMENVLQTAMRELVHRLGIAQIEVHLETQPDLNPAQAAGPAQDEPAGDSQPITGRNGDEKH